MKTKPKKKTEKIRTRIEGLLNNEERQDALKWSKELMDGKKKTTSIESGFFGVKRSNKFDNEEWFDVYKIFAIVKKKKIGVGKP